MSDLTPAAKKTTTKDATIQQMPVQASEGEFAAPLNMAMLATGRNHHGVLQLQRTVGNRATQKLLQREETGAPAAVPVPDAGPAPKAAPIPAAVPAAIDPLTVVLSEEDYADCKRIYKETPSWSELKTRYIETAPNQMQMAKLWAFRRKYVVDLIKSLRSVKYPNLLAKSAGSNDLASDYDITIASPGNDNDVKAIQEFNDNVKNDFGVQPGTLFDTNLYAKDYGAINQSDEFKDGAAKSPIDTAPGHTVVMEQVELDFQDVAALLKLRRYMSQAEWDTYVDGMLENIDEDKQADVQRKYDEADGIYQIYVATLLGTVKTALREQQENAQIQNEEAALQQDVADPAHAQEHNAHDLHEIEHENSDLVLEQSNELYLSKMTEIRTIQAHTTELENQHASLEAIGALTPELEALVEAHFQNPNENLVERIEAERAQVKQLLAEAILYAAEAYISQGAIRHVVAGIQGAKLSDDEKKLSKEKQEEKLKEKRDAANAKLDFNDLQQSFNEQLGDFLKDYGHLAKASPGKFYIKASKYIDRMLDVVLILRGRMGASFPRPLGIERAMGKPFDDIVMFIKTLYGARGDANLWGADREDSSTDIMAALNVRDRTQLKAMLLGLGSEISALIRNQMDAAADADTEMAFFQNRNTDAD